MATWTFPNPTTGDELTVTQVEGSGKVLVTVREHSGGWQVTGHASCHLRPGQLEELGHLLMSLEVGG